MSKCKIPKGFEADARLMTRQQLSRKYNICISTVTEWKRQLGIKTHEWTDAETQKMIKLWNDGKSATYIATALGRGTTTVFAKLREELGVIHEPGQSREAWTDDEICRLRALVEQGKSVSEISRIIGRSESGVKHIMMKLGLKLQLAYRKASLCWDCKNAVPNPDTGVGCSWSERFIPVEGWDAAERNLFGQHDSEVTSYHVIACPEFVVG